MFSSIKSQSRYKMSFYVSFSSSFSSARLIYDNTQCFTGTQPNDQPARRNNVPKHAFFASKMFLTRKSITNRPCAVLYTILPMSVRTQPNDQPARRYNVPKHVFFASKMFLTPKSITNRPYPMLYTILPMSVSLLQENLTPCCDLPKESTFP
jgi:hypothetical protein